MSLRHAFIPYGAYFTTPFSRWQGTLAQEHSMKLAARVTRPWLEGRGIPANTFDRVALGLTVHQQASFYGAPWFAAMIGAQDVTGPTLAQACATSVLLLASTAYEIEVGARRCALAVATDRTSNGPHVYYPNPGGPGGMGVHEDPVWDNFNADPHAGAAMIQTAENAAAAEGISRAEQDEVTLCRYAQYQDALADDRAFQRRYMVEVPLMRGPRQVGTLDADEGIYSTTAEGLAGLRPVLPKGTVTFGTQTHPADGAAGMVVCHQAEAAELSRDSAVRVQVLAFGEARAAPAHMPMAVVPAAFDALARAGVAADALDQIAAFKTHNPFAVNDVLFARAMGVAPTRVNNFGSSLVYGHPQAPTGLRGIIELIEELAQRGGGLGLFSGCAAGDTATAVVIRVS